MIDKSGRNLRSLAGIALIAMSIAAVVFGIMVSDGRPGTEAAINDGGAWLLNRDAGAVGHLNREVLEVTAAVRLSTPGAELDVDQGAGVVVVHDRTDNRVVLLDERTYTPRADLVVKTETEVAAIDGGVVLYETAPLRVWVLTVEQVLEVDELASVQTVYSSATEGNVGVSKQGRIVIADRTSDAMITIVQAFQGTIAAPTTYEVDHEVQQVVPTDTGALLLNDGMVTLVEDDRARSVFEGVSVLQQSTEPITAEVAWISDAGQVVVASLDTGSAAVQGQLHASGYLPPVRHQGCVFTVSLEPRRFVKFCDGEQIEAVDLAGSTGELRLRLVNGWVWINDLDTGGAWISGPDSDLARIDDWGSALANDEVDDSKKTVQETGSDPDKKDNPDADDPLFDQVDQLDEDDENEPPSPVDDVAATRSERPVLIPVLANDVDTDGDVLFISDLDVPHDSKALIVVAPGTEEIQLIPDAGFVGPISFGYTVDDGRGGSAHAQVRVEVLPLTPDGNQPPETITDVAVARAGSPVSLNLLDNDSDPEGDTLALLSVTGESGVVSSNPSGELTFTPDPTGSDGIIELSYMVEDDYGATAEGRLRVRVRIADSNNEPDARNDLVVTNVGSTARVNVLQNDSDPDDDALYVAKQPEAKSLPPGVTVDDITGVQLTPDGAFFFAPPAPGTYRFEYLVSDGQNNDRAQIRVEAQEAEADQPPVAVRDDVAIPIGGTRMVYALDNDSDPNGDVVGIVEWEEAEGLDIREIPGLGFAVTVQVGAPRRVAFRYAISDGQNEPVSTQVVVVVADVQLFNQPPRLAPDSYEVRPGRTSRLPVLLNDSDPEGGSLEIIRVPKPPGHEVEVGVDPLAQAVELTIPAGETQGFTFGYDVSDVDGATAATTVDVRIIDPSEPNRSPIARVDVGRTREATPVSIDVLLNDSDPDSDVVQVESIASQPSFGSAVIDQAGTLTYTPVTGFTGTDRFTYVVVDTEGGRSVGDVEIGVMPHPVSNRAPKANPDRFTVQVDGPELELDVLANDLDPDGDALAIVGVGGVSVGTADSDGTSVTYTPPGREAVPRGETLEATIYYEISDGAGHSDDSTITIRIEGEPASMPPVANDDQAGPVRARTKVLVPVMLNDFDPDGDAGRLRLSSTDPLVSVVGDSLEIVAGVGSAQHSYTITDADGLSDTATVTLFVVDNEAPVLVPLAVQTEHNRAVELNLGAQASDADGDPLYFVCCDDTQGGLVEIDQTAQDTLVVTFTPNDGFSGQATFSYSVDDQQGHLVSGSVLVTVMPAGNRPPEIARDGSVDAEVGRTVSFDLATLVTDPDEGDELSYTLDSVSGPAEVSASGSILAVEVPLDGAGTATTVAFTATDGSGESATGVVVVLGTPTSLPNPTAIADTAQTSQGLPISINLVGNDIDPVGDGLTIVQVGTTPAGVGTMTSPGMISFEPNPDFFGSASFTYTIADATGDTARHAVGQVTLDVVGRPDPPAAPAAVPDNATATVTWSVPPSNGAPVDSYRLAISDLTNGGAVTEIELGVQNSHQASGLVNGHEYAFRLQAHNDAGWGEYGQWSLAVRPDTIPGRPGPPSVAFADGHLDVSWNPPANEGSGLTEYKLEIGGGTSSIVSVGSGSPTYSWHGLTNGVEYQFRVVATNAAGDSDASGWSTSEHPLGAPLQPAPPAVQRGNQYLDLTWSPPGSNGDPISEYEVEVESSGQIVSVTGGATTNYRWAQLTNGVNYRFRVRATNRAPAPGGWSNWSSPVKPCSVPNAPGAPLATRADQSAQLSWSAPSDQGCAITGYNVRVNGGATQAVGGTSLGYTFAGLTNGLNHRFEVQAVNEEGAGAWSPVSNLVVPAGPPTPPSLSSVAVTAVGQITATWSGAGPNGDPIVSYSYRVNGGNSVTVAASPAVLTGLNNSTTYALEVRACNSVGCSAWSGSASATTWGTPGAPTVGAAPGNASASVSWSAGTNGGQPITSWEVTTTPGPISPSGSSTYGRSYTGLTNGTTYNFQVRGCNAVGCGPYGSASATPTAPPPFLTVSVGSQYSGPGCTSGDCQRIQVAGGNFAPNSMILVVCHASNGSAFTSYSTVVSSTGGVSASGCFFGYPGETVWVVADGVTSPSIVWP